MFVLLIPLYMWLRTQQFTKLPAQTNALNATLVLILAPKAQSKKRKFSLCTKISLSREMSYDRSTFLYRLGAPVCDIFFLTTNRIT
jgi:hypothetical protein